MESNISELLPKIYFVNIITCNQIIPVIMGEDRLVAVSEVKTPDFDVAVGRTGDEERRVGRDVHTQYGEFVAV